MSVVWNLVPYVNKDLNDSRSSIYVASTKELSHLFAIDNFFQERHLVLPFFRLHVSPP
jgi:hypothetical protein